MTVDLDVTMIVAIVAGLALVFWLGRMTARNRAQDLSAPPPQMGMPRPPASSSALPPMPMATPPSDGLTPARMEAIRGALLAKNKIMAIKLYREATGLGLAESKDAVEAMER